MTLNGPAKPACLIAAALSLFFLYPAHHAPARADTGEFRDYQGDCLGKLLRWLPPVEIQSSELALDKVSISPSEWFSLNIPLKQPHGPIMELRQGSFKDLGSALEFLRLLQAGKVGHLSVDSFDRHFPFRGLSKQDAQVCERDQMLTTVKKCTICDIREWNNVKP